jgi:hypothetical protein
MVYSRYGFDLRLSPRLNTNYFGHIGMRLS